jgi:membrane-bound serine protease (ClpP class)
VLLGSTAVLRAEGPRAPARPPIALVTTVEGGNDLGLLPFVARVLDEAAVENATIILEINTFGGRVDAAVLIRDALLFARVPTVACVNKRAISARALITLAAEKIVMADGGTVGAATPVEIGLPGAPAQPVAEKTVSYMHKEFRATAERRKRPRRCSLRRWWTPTSKFPVSGIIYKGKLLTLTTEETLKHGLPLSPSNNRSLKCAGS